MKHYNPLFEFSVSYCISHRSKHNLVLFVEFTHTYESVCMFVSIVRPHKVIRSKKGYVIHTHTHTSTHPHNQYHTLVQPYFL